MSIFDIFAKIERDRETQRTQPIEWLVVGLGNPGAKYEGTRHNAGFRALDGYSKKSGQKIDRMKFKALVGEGALGGKRVLFVKPQTFMNLSGEAVRDAAAFYQVPPAHPGQGLRGRAKRAEKHHLPPEKRGVSPRQDRRGAQAAPGVRSGGLGAVPLWRGGAKGH